LARPGTKPEGEDFNMSSSEAVHVFAVLTALPGKEADLREALSALVTPTRAEPGNSSYMLHEDINKPGNFCFFEIYKDQAAVDFHMNSPYLAAALAKGKTWLAAPPMIVSTKLIAGD
jgi:quinol monooxygenase YgiN